MGKFNDKRVLITGGASGIGRIIRAIERNNRVKVITKLIPFPLHFVRFMQGILPIKAFDWIFGQVFG
ncbi:MAG: hypothetical protein II212_01200, partial [Alistipes sp.]|nr:hypothetical protein [Alistipes sp.]